MTAMRDLLFRTALLLGALAFLLTLPAVAREAEAAKQETVQRSFASPEDARQALIAAVQSGDRKQLLAIFGTALHDMEPGDPVEEATEYKRFAEHLGEGVEVARESETKAVLRIGNQKWPFPIPLVKKGNGWQFDTAAGREEILNRRIGRNEIIAINVCRAYVEAQREYYNMQDQDGDQIPKYAQHMISRPGRKDGLYWPSAGGKESPLGPLVAKAKEQGYMQPRKPGEQGPRPFHGYYFKILKKQDRSAPGGKFDYVINGNMVAGYALVAYPSRWGVSGVMTFIVNQSGRVYEKNLGPKTAKIARKMKAYNPDQSWKLVEPTTANEPFGSSEPTGGGATGASSPTTPSPAGAAVPGEATGTGQPAEKNVCSEEGAQSSGSCQ